MCVRGGEQAVRGWGQEQQGVENIVSADSALGIFPFPQGDDSVRYVEKLLQPDQHEECGETPPARPTWRHDPEAESISLTDLDFAVAQLFWVYFV